MRDSEESSPHFPPSWDSGIVHACAGRTGGSCYNPRPIMLTYLLLVLYVATCLFLILVVLLQSGKAGDLASTFGATSSQTAFGARGTATVLSRLTSILAAFFMVAALALSILKVRHGGSVLPLALPLGSGATGTSAPVGSPAPAAGESPEGTTAPATESAPAAAPAPAPPESSGATPSGPAAP